MSSNNTTDIPFQATDPAAAPFPFNTSFTIITPASHTNDIWRKPANASSPSLIDVFNAPRIYKPIPLSVFQSARVTVSAAWSKLYDQGGLVLILPSASEDESKRKWIKTGIEFYRNEAYVSTVVCDRFADWSLVQTGIREGKTVTIEMERDEKEGTLWIYVKGEGERIPIREVTWVLSEEPKERECLVGVYAASPTTEGRAEGLEVQYEDWALEITK